jgi:hypothetical protein
VDPAGEQQLARLEERRDIVEAVEAAFGRKPEGQHETAIGDGEQSGDANPVNAVGETRHEGAGEQHQPSGERDQVGEAEDRVGIHGAPLS